MNPDGFKVIIFQYVICEPFRFWKDVFAKLHLNLWEILRKFKCRRSITYTPLLRSKIWGIPFQLVQDYHRCKAGWYLVPSTFWVSHWLYHENSCWQGQKRTEPSIQEKLKVPRSQVGWPGLCRWQLFSKKPMLTWLRQLKPFVKLHGNLSQDKLQKDRDHVHWVS